MMMLASVVYMQMKCQPSNRKNIRRCLTTKFISFRRLVSLNGKLSLACSGVARQYGARGRTMKLAPLPGLCFHIIQINRLRFYYLNFNKIKYYKADECVIIRITLA